MAEQSRSPNGAEDVQAEAGTLPLNISIDEEGRLIITSPKLVHQLRELQVTGKRAKLSPAPVEKDLVLDREIQEPISIEEIGRGMLAAADNYVLCGGNGYCPKGPQELEERAIDQAASGRPS